MYKNAKDLGIDTKRIAIKGESAGVDSGDVNGPFRRDVNKSERSDAGSCYDA